MRPTLFLGLVLALALPAVAGGTATYDAAACRGPAMAWAADPCAARQWNLPAIRAPQAWARSRGAGVTVAVVDTGADLRHPDLRARLVVVPGSNLVRNTAARCPFQSRVARRARSRAVAQDDHGRGTQLAGIIAAVTGNRRGVAGVAPAAKVMPVKVFDRNGLGTDRGVARGICFAVNQGAKVINLGIGTDPVSGVTVSGSGAQTDRAVAYAYSRGVTVVIGAGDGSFRACDLPESHSRTLCVGAVERRGQRAAYSNFGAAVGVVAPGGSSSGGQCANEEDVWSTALPRSPRDCARDGYETAAGTSVATAHVSAVAALVISRFPRRATPAFVTERLKATADDLGIPDVDPFYGYGRVNAQRAVRR